ncbi:iron ABC transporter permease [Ignatzschineria indica]|uniref:ABC transporter permease n=1 Tax=Ignatzschineria indica TaxID=472583 RepID=UPI00257696A7|nr:iron ABC transporter permease [Ignatzschineria indica]MDM1545574.1 iron ABC transporter permease [Ignatzschineria indica]
MAIVQRRIDPIFYWVLLGVVAFLVLPTYSLDYGLWDSTEEEILESFGWSSLSIGWLWFALPLLLLFRPLRPTVAQLKSVRRNRFDIMILAFSTLVMLVTSSMMGMGLGYSVILLILAFGMILTLNLSRLDYLGGDRFIIAALILIVALIAIFIIYPIIKIFIPVVMTKEGFAPFNFFHVLNNHYILRVIKNSLLLATAVGLTATIFGLILAVYTARIAKRSVIIGRIFALLPIVTPPFVVGLGITLMMGRSGYLTEFAANHLGLTTTNWLYGFTGIWLAQVLAFTPMSFMIIDGAIKTVHPSMEEAAYTLRATPYKSFFTIFLPLLRPTLANSFLIVFVQSLADFSNPLVLGGSFDVLATQIYFYITGAQLNYTSAATLGIVLLLFSLAAFAAQYLWIGKRSYVTVSGKFSRGDLQPLPISLKWIIIGVFFFWTLFNGLLYGSIFYGSFTINWGVDYTLTLNNFKTLFGQGFTDGAWPSLIDTISFAAIAAPVTAFFGILIAYIVVRQNFRGKKTLEFTTMLCFAVPGTVAGVAYLLAFNDAPIYITGTAAIVIISMIMRNVPVGIRAGIAGLGQIDKSLDEASLSLKAGSFKTLSLILIPLLRPAILSALVYSFVRAVTTVSAIIFLVTPDTRVATAYILNRVEDGEYGIAIAYGSILIVVMMAIILIFDYLVGESRTQRSAAKNGQ